MDAPNPRLELADLARHAVWAGVPTVVIVLGTNALIAKYPGIDVAWLFLAVAVPVIALAYAFAFWWRGRHV